MVFHVQRAVRDHSDEPLLHARRREGRGCGVNGKYLTETVIGSASLHLSLISSASTSVDRTMLTMTCYMTLTFVRATKSIIPHLICVCASVSSAIQTPQRHPSSCNIGALVRSFGCLSNTPPHIEGETASLATACSTPRSGAVIEARAGRGQHDQRSGPAPSEALCSRVVWDLAESLQIVSRRRRGARPYPASPAAARGAVDETHGGPVLEGHPRLGVQR